MSHYSQALQQVLERNFDGEQAQLARAAGISQSILSRHCNDQKQPDRETLLKLCQVLDDQDKSNIVIAFLKDLCPDNLLNKIIITTKDDTAGLVMRDTSPFEEVLLKFDPTTRKAIEHLVHTATTNADAREFLRATSKFISKG